MRLLGGDRTWCGALDCGEVIISAAPFSNALSAVRLLGLTCMEHLCRGNRNGHEQSLGVAPRLADALGGYDRAPRASDRASTVERRGRGGEWDSQDEVILANRSSWTFARAAAVGSTCMDSNWQGGSRPTEGMVVGKENEAQNHVQ